MPLNKDEVLEGISGRIVIVGMVCNEDRLEDIVLGIRKIPIGGSSIEIVAVGLPEIAPLLVVRIAPQGSVIICISTSTASVGVAVTSTGTISTGGVIVVVTVISIVSTSTSTVSVVFAVTSTFFVTVLLKASVGEGR